MADQNASKSGKWVDLETGKVVDSEPEHGRQLVAPGVPMTADVERIIADAERMAEENDNPVNGVNVAVEDDRTVDTATAEPRSARRSAGK